MCSEVKPCKICGKAPDEFEVLDMHYIKCRKCGAVELGLRRKTALESWNDRNTENGNHKLACPPKFSRGRYATKTEE